MIKYSLDINTDITDYYRDYNIGRVGYTLEKLLEFISDYVLIEKIDFRGSIPFDPITWVNKNKSNIFDTISNVLKEGIHRVNSNVSYIY